MKYTLENGKTIKINEEDIKRLMTTMKIDQEKAIDIWLEDEGYVENEEQEALCAKAKENRVTATVHQAKAAAPKQKTQRERVVKDNPDKEFIIAETAKFLATIGVEDINISNKGKLIEFTYNGKAMKFDLVEKRVKKES